MSETNLYALHSLITFLWHNVGSLLASFDAFQPVRNACFGYQVLMLSFFSQTVLSLGVLGC